MEREVETIGKGSYVKNGQGMFCKSHKPIFHSLLDQLSFRGQERFAEVKYYFIVRVGENEAKAALALISLFSLPDDALLRSSSGAILSCRPGTTLNVVSVQSILSVVAMIPHRVNNQTQFFVVEKFGLDITSLAGVQEQVVNEEQMEHAKQSVFLCTLQQCLDCDYEAFLN